MLFKDKIISKNYFIFRNFPRFALRTNCTQHHLHTSIFSDPPPQSAELCIVAHFLSAKRHFEKNFLSFKMPPNCVTNNQTATRNTIGTPNPLGLPSPQSTKFWIVAHFPKKITTPKIFLSFRKSSNCVTQQLNNYLQHHQCTHPLGLPSPQSANLCIVARIGMKMQHQEKVLLIR